jgi:hypothetical protein
LLVGESFEDADDVSRDWSRVGDLAGARRITPAGRWMFL